MFFSKIQIKKDVCKKHKNKPKTGLSVKIGSTGIEQNFC